jgi:hypothetical protein
MSAIAQKGRQNLFVPGLGFRCADAAARSAERDAELSGMPAALDNVTAAKLLKLRVVLAGQGGFRLQPNDRTFGALCVLPGREPSVRLSRGFGGKQMARLYLPDGRPQSGIIDLRTAAGFTLLFQSCDSNIWEHGLAESVMPTEIRRLVNWAVVCPEHAVQAAVERLWAGGATVDWNSTDTSWTPTSEVWKFIRACSQSSDDCVRLAAEALKAVLRREVASAPYDAAAAKLDTRRWVVQWVSDAWTLHREEVRSLSGVWVRLKTDTAIMADAAILGRRGDEFLDGKMAHRLTPPPTGARRFAPAAPRSDTASRVTEDGAADHVETWSLRDAAGVVLGMACIAHGDVILCGRNGRDIDALSVYLTDVAMLRCARLPREQAEGS